jgi:beta-lactamase regulating signal transducer with metallopeptidase domain
VHVEQKHTLDVLVTEIVCIVNWFNPFAWLIKKAVRENLEFIADDAVIKKVLIEKITNTCF